MKAKAKRAIIAMSGGVDSSVSAALLKKAGFDVIGIFMKFWKEGKGENRCCSEDSEKRARQVAKTLNIPFYVFNLEKEFKKRIVDSFLKECQKGNTPNPCVICNKEIKFGLFLERALKLNADYIATGHYARIKDNNLYQGKDKIKDQSYFLWKLSKDQLKRVLFPVGEYTKPQVRALAKKFKLPSAEAKESQEICFVPDNINNFLVKHLKPKKGKIVHKGKRIGEHQGFFLFTIGQRKGIKLPGGPFFVADKKGNDLIVTKQEKELLRKELSFKDSNWIVKPKLPLRAKVKIRYKSKLAPALISKNKIRFDSFQRAITPGQSAVFYKGEKLIGGGIIS